MERGRRRTATRTNTSDDVDDDADDDRKERATPPRCKSVSERARERERESKATALLRQPRVIFHDWRARARPRSPMATCARPGRRSFETGAAFLGRRQANNGHALPGLALACRPIRDAACLCVREGVGRKTHEGLLDRDKARGSAAVGSARQD